MIFFKGFCRFLVSRHFWIQKVSRKRWTTKSLENNDFFPKGFSIFSVSRYFWIQKVSINRRNDKIPWNNYFFQGILSFSCFETLLNTKSVWKQEKRLNPLKPFRCLDLYCFDLPNCIYNYVDVSEIKQIPLNFLLVLW